MRAKAAAASRSRVARRSDAAGVPPQLVEHVEVLGRIGDDGDIVVVLGRRADQRRAADVDVLDDLLVRAAGPRHRGLERIEVAHDQVDRPMPCSLTARLMLGIVADARGCRRGRAGAAS